MNLEYINTHTHGQGKLYMPFHHFMAGGGGGGGGGGGLKKDITSGYLSHYSTALT